LFGNLPKAKWKLEPMMNAIQEAELHQSIYHYFLWRQHAQACSTTKKNNNNNDNNKYQMLAGVMAQLFPHYLTPPQHSSSPPPERMQQPQQQQQQQPTTIMPHMIRTLYVDYPALQREGTKENGGEAESHLFHKDAFSRSSSRYDVIQSFGTDPFLYGFFFPSFHCSWMDGLLWLVILFSVCLTFPHCSTGSITASGT
jgi:hypothetical protein